MARTTRKPSSPPTRPRQRRSSLAWTRPASSTTPPRASPTASGTGSERRSASPRAASTPAAPWASTGSSRTSTSSGAAVRSWRRTAGRTPASSGTGSSEWESGTPGSFSSDGDELVGVLGPNLRLREVGKEAQGLVDRRGIRKYLSDIRFQGDNDGTLLVPVEILSPNTLAEVVFGPHLV